MTSRVLFAFVLCLTALAAAYARAQVNTSPAAEATPSVTAAPSEKTGQTSSDDSNGEGEKPFVPHWTGELGLSYSNQPDPQGQSQSTEELSMTGIYNINEDQTYFSLELAAGQQDLEGSRTNYGTLTVEGAYGFGFFQPSLALAQQEGASALNSTTATLTLNFQLLDPLTVGLLGDGGWQSHQGPVSTFSPLASNGDSVEEGDSYNWMWGAQATFDAWDNLSFSLTGEAEYDDTYQFQNIFHTVVRATHNQYDQVDSLTLGADLTFLKDFILDLSLQDGEEFQPAGVFYSPVRKRTLFNAKPTEESFSALTVALEYNFE